MSNVFYICLIIHLWTGVNDLIDDAGASHLVGNEVNYLCADILINIKLV